MHLTFFLHLSKTSRADFCLDLQEKWSPGRDYLEALLRLADHISWIALIGYKVGSVRQAMAKHRDLWDSTMTNLKLRASLLTRDALGRLKGTPSMTGET